MWAKAIDQHAAKSVNRILVGNKCDLVDKRQIATEKGRELANEFGIQFFETSAKNATSVEEAFLTLARDIKKRVDTDDVPAGPGDVVPIGQTTEPTKNGGCCKK